MKFILVFVAVISVISSAPQNVGELQNLLGQLLQNRDPQNLENVKSVLDQAEQSLKTFSAPPSPQNFEAPRPPSQQIFEASPELHSNLNPASEPRNIVVQFSQRLGAQNVLPTSQGQRIKLISLVNQGLEPNQALQKDPQNLVDFRNVAPINIVPSGPHAPQNFVPDTAALQRLIDAGSQQFGAPQPIAYIITFQNENDGLGRYSFLVETSDGTKRAEIGEVKNVGRTDADDGNLAVHGSYSYVGPDGVTYSVTYTADENGFQPAGAHIPAAASVRKV